MSREPEEIHDPDHEIRLSRVAAIDVAKASGKVCTRLPHPTQPQRRITLVWDVASTTNEICALAQRLITDQIERVVLESTSDYWRPFYYILEAHGVTVWLVNANDVKQVPGRPKTDKLDAVWLAKLNERGMLRPSFVPRSRSGTSATTPACATTSSPTGPATSCAWRSCWKTR